jgi:hypothetical protein
MPPRTAGRTRFFGRSGQAEAEDPCVEAAGNGGTWLRIVQIGLAGDVSQVPKKTLSDLNVRFRFGNSAHSADLLRCRRKNAAAEIRVYIDGAARR